CLQDMRLPLTF
nr:immunoglobulin light chain junction region [Macaca mulatta]